MGYNAGSCNLSFNFFDISVHIQTHCDVLGIPVVRPAETESVLLGAAMLGAAAAATAAEGDSSPSSELRHSTGIG